MKVTNPEKLDVELRGREQGFKDQGEVKKNIAKTYTEGAIIDHGGDLLRVKEYDEETGKLKFEEITDKRTIEELTRPAGEIDVAKLDGQKKFGEMDILALVGDLEKPSMGNLPKVVPETELSEKIGDLLTKTQEEYEELEQTLQKAENNNVFLEEHKADWPTNEFHDFVEKAKGEYDTTERLLGAKKKELEALKSFVEDKNIEVKGYAA